MTKISTAFVSAAVACAAFVLPVTTYADNPPPGPKPAWCGKYPGYGGFDADAGIFNHRDRDYHDMLATILAPAKALCANELYPDFRPRALKAREDWMKENEMSEADMADIAGIMGSDFIDPLDEKTPYETDGSKIADLNPVDELRWVVHARALIPESDRGRGYLDSLPNGTHEPVRILFLESCASSYWLDEADAKEHRPPKAALFAEWGFCSGDFAAMSRQQLDAELKASNADAATRFILRARFGRVHAQLAKAKAQLDVVAAKEPDFKRLAFAVPIQAKKDWEALDAKYHKLFVSVLALEDNFRTHSRKALAGCHDVFFPYYKQVAKDADPANQEKWEQALGTSPLMPMLARAVSLCEMQDDNNEGARYWAEILQRTYAGPYVLGVHTMTSMRESEAMSTVKSDDLRVRRRPDDRRFGANSPGGSTTKQPVPPTRGDLPLGDKTFPSRDLRYVSDGIVKTVKSDKGVVRITFEKKSHKAPRCRSWEQTDHIVYWASSMPVYQSRCIATYMATIDDTPPPMVVASFLADGIAVGRSVKAMHGRNDGPGFPIMVRAGNKVVSYLGVKR